MEPGSSGRLQQTDLVRNMSADESLRTFETDSILDSGVERLDGGTQSERNKESGARKLSICKALMKVFTKVWPTPVRSVDADDHLHPEDEHAPQPVSLSIDRSGKDWLQQKLYGDRSIWHYFLYGVRDHGTETYYKTDILWSFVFMVSLIAVIIFSTRSFASLAQTTDVYYTANATENNRSDYTCGCTVPVGLPRPEKLRNSKTSDPNLNVCYDPNSLETVKILMYPNSTAEPLINKMIDDTSASNERIQVTVNSSIGWNGWNVTLQAHELAVQTAYSDEFSAYLAQLYLGGEKQPSTAAPLEYLSSPEFTLSSFPGVYVQMNWVYDCQNCDTCSLDTVINLSRNVVNESWLSCYENGTAYGCGTPAHNYTGKCVLYPPEGIPAQLAVDTFLRKFRELSGITNIWVGTPGYEEFVNCTSLEPDVLFLTSSTATNVSNFRLSFLEVKRGSVLWATLAQEFHTFGTECSELAPIKFCNNGRRLCNLFVDGASNTLAKCIDWDSHDECKRFMNNVTLDNYPDDSQEFSDVVCPANITCREEAPYLVNWNTSQFGQNDTLNSFLVQKIFRAEWINSSGVCTKTYNSVFRHVPHAAIPNTAEPMFLKSECLNATSSQSSFCWLTGYYHKLTDLPNDQAGQKLEPDLFWENPDRFVCYKVENQKRRRMVMNNFGVLFSWIGTVVLVFYALFSGWISVRHKVVGPMEIGIHQFRNWCRGSSVTSVEAVPPHKDHLPEDPASSRERTSEI